jgi:hypothetical protein
MTNRRPQRLDSNRMSICVPGKMRRPPSGLLLGAFSEVVMSARVDQENDMGLWRGVVIKDIFANLFARWAWDEARHIKPILLIRNPFSVALSKQRARRMRWMDDLSALFIQEALFEDFLRAREELALRCRDDFILRQIFIS